MKLNLVFTIAAILLIILGLAQVFSPATMAAATQMEASPSSGFLMTVRFVGVEMLGLGLIAWFVRNTEASKARDGVTLGFTLRPDQPVWSIHRYIYVFALGCGYHPSLVCSWLLCGRESQHVERRKLNPFARKWLTIQGFVEW